MKRFHPGSNARATSSGFSLIELMVGITISLVVMLVIFSVLSVFEGRKRTSTSVNDIDQGGAFGMYVLDKAIRSAGSGFTSVWPEALGCRLNVGFAGTTYLPRPSAFPVPFAAVEQGVRLAPVVIGQGQSGTGSDVLTVMGGTSGFGEAPIRVRDSAAIYALAGPTRSIQLRNTVGFRHGDLVVIGNPFRFRAPDGSLSTPTAATSPPCLMSQVEAPGSEAPVQGIGVPVNAPLPITTSDRLPLGPTAGSYFTDIGTDVQMSALVNGDAYIEPIGNISVAAAGGPPQNPPQFRMFAVGPNQTLMSYDLLRLGGVDAPVEMVEGVVRMLAIYGVDTNGDGIQDAWQAPTGAYAGTTAGLLSGSLAAQNALRSIVSVRVSMLLRTSLPERDDVSPATLPQAMFSDLPGLSQSVTLTAAEQKYRYRIVESTIPLRNHLLPRS